MKLCVLHLLKLFGFFKLSKFFFRKKLLILAYHGVEIYNESSFAPYVFIKHDTLEQRMDFIRRESFNVLPLDDALQKKDFGDLPSNSIVITVDDGWYSTVLADIIFSKFSCPYTVYITTLNVVNNQAVLNVLLQYIIWASCNNTINLDPLEMPEISGSYPLSNKAEKKELQTKLLDCLKKISAINKKMEFVKTISKLLNVDYEKIHKTRCFGLLTFSEVGGLSDKGVDFQLHTHRHEIPFNDMLKLENDLNDNRKSLKPYVKSKLNHFCYPSGRYSSNCKPVLQKMGIISATTCDTGFVEKTTDNYYLPRFLDGEEVSQITFEAELCGVLEFFRKIRKLFIESPRGDNTVK